MNKILCIGEALIDMICTDKGKSLSEGENFLKKPGGAPTNVAAAIAALGGQVELAAKLGTDPFGQHLVEVMKGFGVGTAYMLRDADHFTTFAFVSLMENGERDFYFNRGADGQLNTNDIAQINLEEISLVHFGSATAFMPGPLQEAYTWLLQQARARNRFVSFDPNYRHLLFRNNRASFIEQSWHFLENCDFFKVSDEEALLLTGAADPEQAAQQFLEKTPAVFAITLGKDGTLLGREGRTTIIESIAVNPVDTTGAGDAFVGAILYQLTTADPVQRNQADWEGMIRNANRAGARTCEYLGAMEAFKHLNKNIFK
ncbi:MAG: carbohydrate kinase [Sphingobacteriales bacterium]|nr:carbohydrate kinase [Sphingobacteriales bacterium]